MMPDGREDRVDGLAGVGAQQHQELADERVGAGQRQRGQPRDEERPGQQRRDLRHAAVVGDQAGATAGDQQADHDEQHPGGDAVVDHVERGAGEGLRGEREDPQRDEAEVRDRRVGHETLHVALPDGEQCPVEDPDHGQREHERREPLGGEREQRQAVAQEAERADLVEHPDEQHAHPDGGLGTGVGQPRVERHERGLDRERDEEPEEQAGSGCPRRRSRPSPAARPR